MFSVPNHTQVPNKLLDDLIPTLKEGELRVLFVIVRQTFGWQKQWDRISLSQLEDKTGMGRKAVLRSLSSLIKKGIVLKNKSGRIGSEQCCYSLNVESAEKKAGCQDEKEPGSNNSYQYPKDTPPSVLKTPTKETLTKEKEKKNIKKKAPAAPAITLNAKEERFEGIRDEDINLWQRTYPAINPRKVIGDALLWALSNPRNNYRKSLNAWMANANKEHTTPFKTRNQPVYEPDPIGTQDEFSLNKRLAETWEIEYTPNHHYAIESSPSEVRFIMPDTRSYSVKYSLSAKEFSQQCRTGIELVQRACKRR